jgi:type I restriction-modification system DNA methylase subunit
MPPRKKKSEYTTSNNNNGSIPELMKELWQAAVNLRGSIEPADYKRYVLPIIFLRFLSPALSIDALRKAPQGTGEDGR